MKKILLFLATALSAGSSVTAGNSSFIREDRIWNYSISCWGDIQLYRFQMQFDGTEELDGKTYHCLKTTAIDGYQWSENEQFVKVCGLKGESVFYLREEGDKVYVYDRNHGNPCFSTIDQPKETLLYDYSLKIGDSYVSGGAKRPVLSLKVLGSETILIDGKDTNVMNIGIAENNGDITLTKAIDGIGFYNENGGCCPAFFSEDLISGSWNGDLPQYLPIPLYSGLLLINVTDLDGNVVFDSGMLSGVEEVPDDDAGNNDGRIYDMMGREVKEMQPGGVYIRNGRKFIGK